MYQPGGVAATPVLQAPTSTAKGRQGGGELERGSEMSLRELHSARVNSVRDEEARIQAQDEAKWVEAEQLVAALKASKEEPPSKPRPPVLHSNGAVLHTTSLLSSKPRRNTDPFRRSGTVLRTLTQNSVPTSLVAGQVDKLIFAQPSMNSWVNEYKYK